MTRTEALAALRAAKPLLDAYKVSRIAVFGSVARNEAKEGSDLDILVEFFEVPDLLDFVGLQQDLGDRLGVAVDLATPAMLHRALKDRILAEAVYA